MATERVKNFCRFSKNQDKKLIKRVKCFPSLYDPRNEKYRNKVVRNSVWREIGENIQRTDADCKTRWRTLRDLYNRKLRQIMKNPRGNGVSWEHMDQMSFLKNVPNNKKLLSSLPDFTDSVVVQEDALDIMEIDESKLLKYTRKEQSIPFPKNECTFTKKIIRDQITEVIDKEFEETMDMFKRTVYPDKSQIHPTELFFDDMAKIIITFPPALAIVAKYEISKIVTNFEYDSLSYIPECHTPSSETSSSQLYRDQSEPDFCQLYQNYCSSEPPSRSASVHMKYYEQPSNES